MRERIVVTGMGTVTPLGIGVSETWKNLIEGKSGIRKLEKDVNSQVNIAGIVEGFEPTRYIPGRELLRVHRAAQFSQAAVIEALIDAGFCDGKTLIGIEPEDIGIQMGTGIGGGSEIAEMEGIIREFGDTRISQYSMLNLLPERVATVPGKLNKFRGPTATRVAACATGSWAVVDGVYILLEDDAKVMAVGGTEAVIHRIGIGGFNAMGALSRNRRFPGKASRPFDKKANGFVVSEGAGALILELLSHALSRGAKIHAEITGYGNTSDAFHDTVPSGEGAVRAIKLALRKAGIEPEDIDYINAHGTSTPAGDGRELDALSKVFGKNLKNISVSSTKSATGHLLGAAGAVESIFCIKTIEEGIIPPTLNLRNPIRRGLDLVPNYARQREVNTAMSNSFGFGGINSVLIFKKYPEGGE